MSRPTKNFEQELWELIEAIKDPYKLKNKKEFLSLLNDILQPSDVISKILNIILSKEREYYMKGEDDIANGYYP